MESGSNGECGDDAVRAHNRAYYETEAELRRRRPAGGPRGGLRRDFVELLRDEQRRSVVDLGAGPGHDGIELVGAGFYYVGIDISVGNALLAAEQGLRVVPASMERLPLRPHSFDAGWSMSALMHLPPGPAIEAVDEMTRVLRPGAPLFVGVWGGVPATTSDEVSIDDRIRHYHQRPWEENRELLARAGAVTMVARWTSGVTAHQRPDEDYQVFLVRIGR